jgi:hypothetical protein
VLARINVKVPFIQPQDKLRYHRVQHIRASQYQSLTVTGMCASGGPWNHRKNLFRLPVYTSVCVSVYECTYVCMLCVYAYTYVCVCMSVCVSVYECTYVRKLGRYAYTYVCERLPVGNAYQIQYSQ